MNKIIQTDKAPLPIGPYSQAVVTNGFVFCAGQIAINPKTVTIPQGLQEQTKQVMENLGEVLKAAGSDFEHVVKTTVFIIPVEDFPKVNEVYSQYFSKNKPVRSTVGVAKLPQGKFSEQPLIEIELIATVK